MRLVAVGCSGSFPGPQSPSSCYLVQAEHEGRTWSVVLDLGNGSLGALQQHLDPRDLDAVVLSHLHPDHCLDVCGLAVMLGHGPDRPPPMRLMPVYAPQGAAQRLGRAYGVTEDADLTDRFAFETLVADTAFVVGPFTITPVPVRHPVEAYGLRVRAGSSVLAYTGDTDSCPELTRLCAGASLMLADCAHVDGRDDAVRGVHLSGSRAAEAALAARGVGRLVLTHLPAWNDPGTCRAQAAAVWDGPLEVVRPGATYEV